MERETKSKMNRKRGGRARKTQLRVVPPPLHQIRAIKSVADRIEDSVPYISLEVCTMVFI